MEIISGNYGLGRVKFVDDKFIVAETGVELPFHDIKMVESAIHKNTKQSIGSVLLGLFIVTPILFLAFNIFGLVVGVVLSLIGSQYSTKSYTSEATFNNDTKIKFSCSKREMNELSSLGQVKFSQKHTTC